MLSENLAGVIFSFCLIWLFIIKWTLFPQRERLPLAFQAGVIFCLGMLWIVLIRWYESLPIRYPPYWWMDIVYFYIPLPIALLGCRFVWCFFSARNEKSWPTQFCFQICLFLTVLVLLSVVHALLIPKQKVREAAILAGIL
jgi:hypothetical protein